MKLLDTALLIINTLVFVFGHAHKNEVELMLRTVLTESAFSRNGKLYFHRKQLGCGVAKSIFQIEPRTAKDILQNYLTRKPAILSKVKLLAGTDDLSAIINDIDLYLMHNQPFACAVARCVYLRRPEPIPVTAEGLCAYYKRWYNTYKGKGSVEKCENDFVQFGGYEVINQLFLRARFTEYEEK